MKEMFIYHCLQPSLSVLYMLSDGATHEAVHLLCRMLVFDPVSSDNAHWRRLLVLMFVLLFISDGMKVMCWYLSLTPVCFLSRPNVFPAATPSPTRTWTKGVCVTTPACVSAATLFPAGESTPETLSRSPNGRSATATRTVCFLCGREKVHHRVYI